MPHTRCSTILILDDPLALKILGDGEHTGLASNQQAHHDPLSTGLRTSVVVRSRFAEDEWAQAAQQGLQQYVILGAGLDTYAYRQHHHEGRIFEVDLPSTQAWKRERLGKANIDIPSALTYVATNFEHGTLGQALSSAGFNKQAPAFFS